MDIDLTTLRDDQLVILASNVTTEQNRRRKRAEIVAAEQQLAAEALDKLARRPGDPWAPPTALTAYPMGEQVTHQGRRWASLLDGNVWEPGISGWREITADGSPPQWLQPSGAHDAYRAGATVTHNGHTWRSKIDANVWPPDVYPAGWEQTSPGADVPDNDGSDPEPEEPAPATPTWAAGTTYAVNDRVTFQGGTYRAVQPHTSQTGWEPAAVPALWAPA